MNPLTLVSILDDPEFLVGLATGGAGAFVLLLVRRGGMWFFVWAAAAIVALVWSDWTDRYYLTPMWAVPLAMVGVFAATLGVSELERRAPTWSIALGFALWILGVWGTVPDTEGARALLGVTTAMMPALWPMKVTTLGGAGAFFASAVVVIVASTDGAARHGSIIGALGGMGMLLVAPLVLKISKARTRREVSGRLLLSVQVVFVILSGRVAGRVSSAGLALLLWLITAVLLGAVWKKLEDSRATGAAKPGRTRFG